MTTIKEIANEVGVSTATVSRVLNNSSQVSAETRKKVEEAVERLGYDKAGEETSKKTVTIKEVAEEAGVSEATVSRVLNDSDKVAAETREKVNKAISKLEYTPNMNARYLRKNETKLVGLIIPDIANSFFSEIMKGAENLAHLYGYNVVLLETGGDFDREVEAVRILKDRRADGMIYMGRNLDQEKEEVLAACDFPVVVISREEAVKFPTININNYQAAYEMVEYLIGAGYEEIGFISGYFEDETAGLRRFRGYRAALRDNKLEFRSEWVEKNNFTLDEGYQAMQKILNCAELPEAVFAASDELAIGAMQAIKEKGFKIPEDIALVGFDNINLSRYVYPNLTTIAQPIYKLGKKGMEMVIKLINDEELTEKDVYLDYELIIRESS